MASHLQHVAVRDKKTFYRPKAQSNRKQESKVNSVLSIILLVFIYPMNFVAVNSFVCCNIQFVPLLLMMTTCIPSSAVIGAGELQFIKLLSQSCSFVAFCVFLKLSACNCGLLLSTIGFCYGVTRSFRNDALLKLKALKPNVNYQQQGSSDNNNKTRPNAF